jgi:Flp pilus assembly protein TadG
MNLYHSLDRKQCNTARTRESGQALVEVAFTAGMLLIMLIGAVEIGRVAYAAIEVTNAAKAAVQYGAQNRNTAADVTGMQAAAANEATALNNLNTQVSSPVCTCADDGATVACSYSSTAPAVCSGSAVLETLTVQTSATFDPLFHIPGLANTYTLHGEAVQQVLSSND